MAVPLTREQRDELRVVCVVVNLVDVTDLPCERWGQAAHVYLGQELQVAARLRDLIIGELGFDGTHLPLAIKDPDTDEFWVSPNTSGMYRLSHFGQRWPGVSAVLAVDLKVSIQCMAPWPDVPAENRVGVSADAWLLRVRDARALFREEYHEYLMYEDEGDIEDVDVPEALSLIARDLGSDLREYFGQVE